MKISVAMCTFDGARYIEEQILSLLGQTRPPDEIIVRDDGSTDGTVGIVADLLTRSGIPHVVEVNESNLGSTANFERAIKSCSGDLICLCDQDDIWESRKLEVIERLFSQSPSISWAFSDGTLVDETSKPIPGRLWERFGFDERVRRRFQEGTQLAPLLRRNFVTGCTCAIRAEALDGTYPFPRDWVHDQWLAMRLALLGRIGVAIEEPLIRYRLHRGQQVGGMVRTPMGELRSGRKVDANAFRSEIRRLERLAHADGPNPAIPHCLRDKIRHFEARERMRTAGFAGRSMMAVRELLSGRYRYSWSAMAFFRDLLGR